jgi:hypothetical protein
VLQKLKKIKIKIKIAMDERGHMPVGKKIKTKKWLYKALKG